MGDKFAQPNMDNMIALVAKLVSSATLLPADSREASDSAAQSAMVPSPWQVCNIHIHRCTYEHVNIGARMSM